jgi:hypothetical protein
VPTWCDENATIDLNLAVTVPRWECTSNHDHDEVLLKRVKGHPRVGHPTENLLVVIRA